MNNKEKGLICLCVILACVLVIGNIFLLFFWAAWLLDVGVRELADDPFHIIMAVAGGVIDTALVGYFFVKNVEKKRAEKEKKREEWERQQEEREQQREKKRISDAEEQREEREKKRTSSATQTLNKVVAHYIPGPLKNIPLQETSRPSVESALLNHELVSTVKQYKEKMGRMMRKCNEVDQAINQILLCEGCANVDERLDYLFHKENELQQLKDISDTLHDEIDKRRIRLLNEDEGLLLTVKYAFMDLFSSKKCVTEGAEIKEFICEEKPVELELFDYKYEPTILRLGEFIYCLFSNVILLFDHKGVFATAVDPTALSIQVERVTETLYVWNSTMPSSPYIDTDSKCVLRGETWQTWLHTCRNGSPDLRYSHNPRVEHRTDKYEYGKVDVSLLGNTITIRLSSETVTDNFEQMSRAYIRKCNNRHNPIPELMNLLYNLSEDTREDITYISHVSRGMSAVSNYFCVID